MAVCGACNQDMALATTCTEDAANVRIRWGSEPLLGNRAQFAAQRGVEDPMNNPVPMDDPEADAFFKLCHVGPYVGDRRCPDCNVRPGGLHHPGCDTEECANCQLQALGCDCDHEALGKAAPEDDASTACAHGTAVGEWCPACYRERTGNA